MMSIVSSVAIDYDKGVVNRGARGAKAPPPPPPPPPVIKNFGNFSWEYTIMCAILAKPPHFEKVI